MRAAAQNQCVVVNDAGIVLGRLGRRALDANPETVAETVMESGPTTVRPSTSRDAILRRMRKGKADSLLVTTADGRLVGVLHRPDIEGEPLSQTGRNMNGDAANPSQH